MNPELINLLISLDKTAENLQSKTFKESITEVDEEKNKFDALSMKKSIVLNKNQPGVVSQQDRRARRTLRAKVNCILNGLPECCKNSSQKQLKSMKKLKKKKLDEINIIRRKNGKEILNIDDFSLNDSFDMHGNIKKRIDMLSIPLTPRSALREKLNNSELEMLKEDPVYFIQNEKYKYKIKLNDDEN